MQRQIIKISLNVMPDINIAIKDVSGYQTFKGISSMTSEIT